MRNYGKRVLVVLMAAILVAGCTGDSGIVLTQEAGLTPEATAPAQSDIADEFAVTFPDTAGILAHIEQVDGSVSADLVADQATGVLDSIVGTVEGEPFDVRFGEGDLVEITIGDKEIDYSLNPDGTETYRLVIGGVEQVDVPQADDQGLPEDTAPRLSHDACTELRDDIKALIRYFLGGGVTGVTWDDYANDRYLRENDRGGVYGGGFVGDTILYGLFEFTHLKERLRAYENGGCAGQAPMNPSQANTPDDPEPPPADDESESPQSADPAGVLVFSIDATSAADAQEQGLGSGFQVIDYDDPYEGREFSPAIFSPDLAGGTMNVTIDLEQMTLSGDFTAFYECDAVASDKPRCIEAFETITGTALGSFTDLAIVEAPTTETPPDGWALPAEDWYPGDEGDWFVMGPAEIQLSIGGVVEIGSSTAFDGEVTRYRQTIDDYKIVTAFVHNLFYVYRDPAGVITEVDFAVRLDFYSEGRPSWGWTLHSRHTVEGPLADPFAE